MHTHSLSNVGWRARVSLLIPNPSAWDSFGGTHICIILLTWVSYYLSNAAASQIFHLFVETMGQTIRSWGCLRKGDIWSRKEAGIPLQEGRHNRRHAQGTESWASEKEGDSCQLKEGIPMIITIIVTFVEDLLCSSIMWNAFCEWSHSALKALHQRRPF